MLIDVLIIIFYNKFMFKVFKFFILTLLLISTNKIYAQMEAGTKFAVYLPAGIPEIDQVLKGLNLSFAYPLPGTGHIVSTFEFATATKAYITGISVDARTPAPQGEFTPYLLLGLHLYYTKGSDTETGTATRATPKTNFTGGINFGGGFTALLKDKTFLDFNLRFNANPGKVVMIGVGLNLQI